MCGAARRLPRDGVPMAEGIQDFRRAREAQGTIKTPGVSAAAAEGYESMGKPELIRELMRRDIEVARLKKGYSVKGGGSKKEYVISSGSNTK